MFNNEELGFRRWSRTVCNLTVGVFGKEFQDVLEYCLDRDDPVDMTELENKFGIDPEIDPDVGIPGLADKCDQLYRVLSSLTSGESGDLVVGCANLGASGFEAWRRLNRRWDPVTAGRKRNILRAILNPERTKTWEGVRPAIEQLDDLIRRYEARKNESGAREVLSDDIKCTAIELLVPQDLEKHLILNKSRLTNYSLIKQEIEVLMETTLGSKSKIHRPGSVAASSSQGPAPMEVDAITQWLGSLVKGKGKGKGKGPKGQSKGKDNKGSGKGVECYNCGKIGHKAADCWSKKKDNQKGNNSKGNPQETKVQKDVVKAQKEKERKEQQLLRNRKKKRLRNQRMNKKSECLNSMALSWSTKRKMIWVQWNGLSSIWIRVQHRQQSQLHGTPSRLNPEVRWRSRRPPENWCRVKAPECILVPTKTVPVARSVAHVPECISHWSQPISAWVRDAWRSWMNMEATSCLWTRQREKTSKGSSRSHPTARRNNGWSCTRKGGVYNFYLQGEAPASGRNKGFGRQRTDA